MRRAVKQCFGPSANDFGLLCDPTRQCSPWAGGVLSGTAFYLYETMKIHKTNAARILDKAGITYRLIPYEVDEDDLSAAHLAEQLGIDPDGIFKTLVLSGDKSGYFVCLIPGGQELDLKKAARVSGNKSCSMIPMKALRDVTGYIRGGCSPVGMKKLFPTYVHETVTALPEVHVSAGQRGLQLLLKAEDLLTATRGAVADLTEHP